MSRQYPFSAYDSHLCLTFSTSMWLASLFLIRPFAILIMSVVKKGDRTGLLDQIYGSNISTMYLEIIAALPAILILFALMNRKPGASKQIKWIWSYGRILLLSSTLLNILSLFTPLLWKSNIRMDAPELIKLAICIAVIIFLLKSERVKDTFNDFPQPGAENDK